MVRSASDFVEIIHLAVQQHPDNFWGSLNLHWEIINFPSIFCLFWVGNSQTAPPRFRPHWMCFYV